MTGAAGTPGGAPAGTVAGSTAGSSPADPGPEPHDEQGAPGPAPGRRRWLWRGPSRWPALGRRVWLAVAGAVVVGTLVLAVVALLRMPSDAEVRDSALLAARTYSTSLTTFDARTLDEDVERVRRSSTPEFAQEYDQTIAQLRETVTAEQTVSTGTVVGAGLERLSGDTATVLVAVNQEIVSAGAPPRTEANRLRMVLERREGDWLIRDVERL